MQPHQTTTRQVLGLVVAMLIAGVATLAAGRLHWPDMLVALGLGLLLAPTLRGARCRLAHVSAHRGRGTRTAHTHRLVAAARMAACRADGLADAGDCRGGGARRQHVSAREPFPARIPVTQPRSLLLSHPRRLRRPQGRSPRPGGRARRARVWRLYSARTSTL